MKVTLAPAFILALAASLLVPTGLCSTSFRSVPVVGAIVYSPVNAIAINALPNQSIGVNRYTLGFQLDGPDIKTWRDRAALRDLAENASFKLVRFFEHRLGKACTSWNAATKTGSWNWAGIDSLLRRIFEIGAEPLIVLGFYSWSLNRLSSTPEGMLDNPVTGLPYPDQWGAYCAEWVKHIRQAGLPVRYYEIINEPHHYFGWGRYANDTRIGYYMELFNAAATAMRAEDQNVKLGNDNSLFKKVFDYFVAHGKDLGFLSLHRYGLDSRTQSDAEAIEAAETKYLIDDASMYSPETASRLYKDSRGLDLPVILTEGNLCDDYDPIDPRTHTMLGAVYTALSIRTFILKGILHSVYFIFGSSESAMGMVSTNTNLPRYAYYAQQMIGQNLAVGDELVETTTSSSDVSSLGWLHEDKLMVLLICKVNGSRAVRLQGISTKMNYVKIDTTVSWQNPRVQTGTILPTDTLNLNGYAVALIQISESR